MKELLINCYGVDEKTAEIDDAKRIDDLERRKKHCKNYLELKQINRELQELKFNSNVRRYRKIEY